MHNAPHAPAPGELPTTGQLNRATLIAAAVAGVLLVTTVLPAEYGVDPLGTGRLMGLTAIGEAKAAEAAAGDGSDAEAAQLTLDEPTEGAPTLAADAQEVTVTLQPGEGREIKATMQAGDQIAYEWATADKSEIKWELHGEEAGAASNEYTSYEIATSNGESGSFRAPFAGTHGWYWRNRSDAPVTIVAKASGEFSKFELVPEK